ncbi:MAG: pyridoxal phosphate-dependent aminotransferase [Thermoanaerobaculia bacterium]|nr:pyridoxal phosphate-dependent aminotransferase [Thermoanaerobaculia bacterium]
MFSRRADWSAPVNRLTLAREERAQRGLETLDLTLSNPTRAGIDYPFGDLADALSHATRAPYDPQPLGIRSAREAVAREHGADPDDVVITASTSEAYAFLFKLLTDPGDELLTAVPSYPLLDHLAQLEQVRLVAFPLELHARWEITRGAVASAITPRVRAIIAVSPNNPTGSYVRESELAILSAHGLPLIVDEVFRDYPIAARDIPRGFARSDETLTFSLGGLSKSAGLPHLKLGWIIVSGPTEDQRKAIAALELIADNFLSVATPVQEALPDILRIAKGIQASILQRIRRNHEELSVASNRKASCSLLPVEGGWSAVLRVPRTRTDEETALLLLSRGVLVQPGYFFDFEQEGHLVVSLLTPPEHFDAGIARIMDEMP